MRNRRITILVVSFILLSLIFISLTILPFLITPANKWVETSLQIDKLHDLGFDGTNITIGIIDTGVDTSHQEFDATSFLSWTDYIANKTTPYDDEDHGTHLAGLLVAQGSFQGLFSGYHLQGIVPNAKLIIVKSIPQNQYLYGGGNDSTIAKGLRYCIDHDADIILLSLGMSPEKVNFTENTETTTMIHLAVQKGIFIIVPVGNDGQDDNGDVCLAATYNQVISVGSITKEMTHSVFSSKGHQYPATENPNKKPELVAPGEDIISTRTKGAYGTFSGTSQAATYITGVLALLLNAYPAYKHNGSKNHNVSTIQLFKTILATTAKKIGPLDTEQDQWSHNDYYGYGLIQAYDAYIELGKYA